MSVSAAPHAQLSDRQRHEVERLFLDAGRRARVGREEIGEDDSEDEVPQEKQDQSPDHGADRESLCRHQCLLLGGENPQGI